MSSRAQILYAPAHVVECVIKNHCESSWQLPLHHLTLSQKPTSCVPVPAKTVMLMDHDAHVRERTFSLNDDVFVNDFASAGTNWLSELRDLFLMTFS